MSYSKRLSSERKKKRFYLEREIDKIYSENPNDKNESVFLETKSKLCSRFAADTCGM